MSEVGVVYLVGAGPGDPALLTRRGAELLERADVVVYDGLVNAVLLDLASPECERIYGGKKHAPGGTPLTQEQISGLLVERAQAGKTVVRLKGGDPFVFGRGAEECEALAAAGVRFEIVPGVSAATAVTAYAGIPLTARNVSSTVAFATGHEAAGKPDSAVDWQALARAGTVVLFMAWRTARDCAQRLIAAGKPADTPAAAIYWGTTAAQHTVTAPLSALPDAIAAAGLKPPVLLVIGPVVELREQLRWYERRPLFGVRALITRGIERAGPFAHLLADLGAEPLALPVTRLVDAGDEAAAAVASAIARIADYDWIVLTSVNTVGRFVAALHAAELDARALGNARLACVGPATAAALADHGLRADIVPRRGDAVGVAEAIIAASAGQVAGTQVLVPRAVHGRDEAINALRAAGAGVDVVHIYETAVTPADDPALGYGLERLRKRDIGVICFFAPSQVRALFELVGDDAAELIGACPIVAAIGNTTRRALQKRGVNVQVVPSKPHIDVLAAEVAFAYTSTRSGE